MAGLTLGSGAYDPDREYGLSDDPLVAARRDAQGVVPSGILDSTILESAVIGEDAIALVDTVVDPQAAATVNDTASAFTGMVARMIERSRN